MFKEIYNNIMLLAFKNHCVCVKTAGQGMCTSAYSAFEFYFWGLVSKLQESAAWPPSDFVISMGQFRETFTTKAFRL